jgi:class 3 adenylate cyclase
MTGAAPSGVVTFLFTDIEGSTRRRESDADAMRAALLVHDQVLRTAIETHGGYLFSHTGERAETAVGPTSTSVRTAPGTRPIATKEVEIDDVLD